MRKISLTGIVLTTALSASACLGFAPENLTTFYIETHTVDQVNRVKTHPTVTGTTDGWRTYHTSSDGELTETFYADSGGFAGKCMDQTFNKEMFTENILRSFKLKDNNKPGVHIYKDLENGVKGYANVIRFNPKSQLSCTYVEIHIPQDQQISITSK